MIVSFHPIIEAGCNIICAGREPNAEDLAAIQQADAVILPQGCPEALYRMVRMNCPLFFPNLDVRFDYPGKRGQLELFRKLDIAHPFTQSYDSVADYHRSPPKLSWPAVVKFNWGGQGDTVFKVDNPDDLATIVQKVASCEDSGQYGFSIQQFIPTRDRSLRVVVVGNRTIAYWRIQPVADCFGTSVTGGARIDHDADPDLQKAARAAVLNFCRQTGLQLAGFDFIFDERDLAQDRIEPLMLEINYYFGRTGLGGSEAYYKILEEQIDAWLAGLSLNRSI